MERGGGWCSDPKGGHNLDPTSGVTNPSRDVSRGGHLDPGSSQDSSLSRGGGRALLEGKEAISTFPFLLGGG